MRPLSIKQGCNAERQIYRVGVDYCIGDVLALGIVVACSSGVIEPSRQGKACTEWNGYPACVRARCTVAKRLQVDGDCLEGRLGETRMVLCMGEWKRVMLLCFLVPSDIFVVLVFS